MRALVFDGPDRPLRLEERPPPEAGPGEVIVKVAYCGVCGSDLHGTEPGPFQLPPGVVLGHEFAGEVAESAAQGIAVGDRVIGVPLAPCADCGDVAGACRDGLGILCPQTRIVGLAPSAPGAYADYVRLGAPQILPVPQDLPLDAAALAEPLAVGAHAVGLAGPPLGRRVLVQGAGPIGLATIAFAQAAGAGRIVVSEIDPVRRERAAAFGATAQVDPRADDLAAAFQAAAGGPPETIFECVGVPGMLRASIDLAAVRGRIVVVGVVRQEDSLLPRIAIRKELSLQFALGYVPRDFTLALDLLAKRPSLAAAMITARVGFAELPDLFEALRRPNPHGKVLLQPGAALSPA